ncbi:MAG: formylglycine-generating enzyme family protein [Planctomyces sp.]
MPCNPLFSEAIWEWCSDWYGVYETGEVVDPAGPVTGDLRVSRGGAFTLEAGRCRSAIRNGFRPAVRDHDVGFRVVKATW